MGGVEDEGVMVGMKGMKGDNWGRGMGLSVGV